MNIEAAGKAVVIVDAYSSGRDIAPKFNQLGYRCIHIQSRSTLPQKYLESYRPNDFFLNLPYAGSETIYKLAKYGVIGVIAGSETGIELADHLAQQLGVPGNKVQSSATRRNKYMMQESLRARNLGHIPTYRLASSIEAEDYAAKLLSTYGRLILKPADSAGTDSVFVCTTIESVVAHTIDLLQERNQLNLKNDAVILQPFIEGAEFVVDTVSYGGHHKICAIWRMSKGSYNGADSICEFTELTSFDERQHTELQTYVFNCLDALGIEFGAGHSELFLTKEGWKLIETGARPHGAGFPALSALALERTQIDELVSSVSSSEKFLGSVGDAYQPLNHLRIKELIAYSAGEVRTLKNIDSIKNLPSYRDSRLPNIGQKIELTVDVFSSPGWIALSHQDADQISADYQRVVELESMGLFVVNE